MSISPVNFINSLLKSVKKKPEAISSKVVDCGQIQDTILKLPENIDLNRFVPADVVNNNVTFWLPLTGGKRCNIHMRRV